MKQDIEKMTEWARASEKSSSKWIDNFHLNFYPTGHPDFEYYEIVIFSNPEIFDDQVKALAQARVLIKEIDKHLEIKEFKLFEKRSYHGQPPTFYIYVGSVEVLQV